MSGHKWIKFNVTRHLEHGGIGDIDAITGPLHRSGAIPSHFVFALHRQRKCCLPNISTKHNTTRTQQKKQKNQRTWPFWLLLRHHLPRFLFFISPDDVNCRRITFKKISLFLSLSNAIKKTTRRLTSFRFVSFLSWLAALNVGREIATSSAKSYFNRHAWRLLLFSNGFRGSVVDVVTSTGTTTSVAWNVHRLQPTLSTPSAIFSRSRSLYLRRSSHPQTQRRQLPQFFSLSFYYWFFYSISFHVCFFFIEKNRILGKIRLCDASFTTTSGSFTPTTTGHRPSVTLFKGAFHFFLFLLIKKIIYYLMLYGCLFCSTFWQRSRWRKCLSTSTCPA